MPLIQPLEFGGKAFPRHFVFLLGLKSLLWNNNFIEIVGRDILTAVLRAEQPLHI